MSQAAKTGTKHLLHIALSPVYLAAAVFLVTIATGLAPEGALLAAGIALAASIPPALLVLIGVRTGHYILLRLAIVVAPLEVVLVGLFMSPGELTDMEVVTLDAQVLKSRLAHASDSAYPDTLRHAQAIAACGPRGTGSAGLEKVLAYARGVLAARGWDQTQAIDAGKLTAPVAAHTIRISQYPTLVPQDQGSHIILKSGPENDADTIVFRETVEIRAFGLMPNSIQPARTPPEGLHANMVYLGRGRDEDVDGKTIKGRIAVLEFDSGRRWLWACERGAVGAVFLGIPNGTNETVRQADAKYLALVPLNFPRVYVPAPSADILRQAAQSQREIVMHSRMDLQTVPAPVYEALIPGTDTDKEMLVMCHADARAIAPALSYGGQEAYSLAAWLSLFEYFSEHPARFGLRFVLTTGHWQSQGPARGYGYAIRELIGPRLAMAIGIDLNPESDALIITDDSIADVSQAWRFKWLKKLLFTVDAAEPGWLDQIYALSSRPELDRGDYNAKYAFFSGRPVTPGNQWSAWLAPVDKWPPHSHSANHPTANHMMSQVGGFSIALRTCLTYRQKHFTCTDQFEPWQSSQANLQPQLELLLTLLGGLADINPEQFPELEAEQYQGWGGYNRMQVQVQRWNPEILWYDKKMPPGLRAYVMLVPGDLRFNKGRTYAYWPRPMAPTRFTHRQMQSFQALYTAEVDENGLAVFPNVYTRYAVYDALAYCLDIDGKLVYAFNQGFHGDSEFHFLDRKVAAANMLFQVPVFECGALALFGLTDPDRINIAMQVENEYKQQWGIGNDQDSAEVPFLPIVSVREAETHTEVDEYAWVQYRDTAMVFLKPLQRCEVIAGNIQQKTLLFNDDPQLRTRLEQRAVEEGIPFESAVAAYDRAQRGRAKAAAASLTAGLVTTDYVGFAVQPGEERRLLNTLRVGVNQLANVTDRRLDGYADLNVKSPSANMFQARADVHVDRARNAVEGGDQGLEDSSWILAFSAQSQAYQSAYRLLIDVVSTTIFYFLLLLPFGYLVERLVLPQPSLMRTCLVVAGVFILFTVLLYIFHPGFHLASNIFVTVVTFVIVILTLPALMIIVSRGVALSVEPGARFKQHHSAGAERLGVLTAALSLAVNNMRRRKLRTVLTLSTITVLVTSLVLLTSTAVDTHFYRESQNLPHAGYRGVQVFNTHDHIHGLSERTVQILEQQHREKATVIVRRYFNPGYEASIPCYLLPRETDGVTRRFSVRGAISISPQETGVSGLDRAIIDGRFIKAGDRQVCLLANDLARKEGFEVGDVIRFLGLDLTIIGLLNHTAIDADIVDIAGRPVTPLAFYRQAITSDDPDYLRAAETIFVPEDLVNHSRPAPFAAYTVVLVPHTATEEEIRAREEEIRDWQSQAARDRLGRPAERLVRASAGKLNETESQRIVDAAANLREAARYNLERSRIRDLSEEIPSQHTNVDVFLTVPAPPWTPEEEDRVELQSAFNRVSLKSGSFLILPFLISFLMLLAIMIGGVYERRREIHVFSSVGLAPRHVAGMFLAEAVVYGGIASVAGYFIGIILLSIFRQAGWLPADFYPNYFGKVVIWSAVLAMSSSLLSVIYPMRIAARMVNPSLERIWQIDTDPIGRAWTIHLPFVAMDRNEVIGILQFVCEFVSHHRGERTGTFAIESDPELALVEGVPVMRGIVWLSPFERNLVQHMTVAAQRDETKARYHFDLNIERISGPDYLWRKSNHTFVDALRKQMLIWRSLVDEATHDYIRHGRSALELDDETDV